MEEPATNGVVKFETWLLAFLGPFGLGGLARILLLPRALSNLLSTCVCFSPFLCRSFDLGRRDDFRDGITFQSSFVVDAPANLTVFRLDISLYISWISASSRNLTKVFVDDLWLDRREDGLVGGRVRRSGQEDLWSGLGDMKIAPTELAVEDRISRTGFGCGDSIIGSILSSSFFLQKHHARNTSYYPERRVSLSPCHQILTTTYTLCSKDQNNDSTGWSIISLWILSIWKELHVPIAAYISPGRKDTKTERTSTLGIWWIR